MGIRIIIASTSGEKAKYKERILDWIIAFCLLFFMHYIMAASVTVVEKINNTLGQAAGVFDGIDIPSEFGKVKYDGTKGAGFVGSSSSRPSGGWTWSDTTSGMSDDDAINACKGQCSGNLIKEDSGFIETDSKLNGPDIRVVTYKYTAEYDTGTLEITKTRESRCRYRYYDQILFCFY